MLKSPYNYIFLICALSLFSYCCKRTSPETNKAVQDIENINLPDTLYCKGEDKLAFPNDFPKTLILLVRSSSACSSCFNDLVNNSVLINKANNIGSLFILLPNMNPEQLEKISSFYPSPEYKILCPIVKDTILIHIKNHMIFYNRNDEKQKKTRSFSIVDETDINIIFKILSSHFTNN